MVLDTQSIVAVIALLITCPPTIWLLYKLYMRYRHRENYGIYMLPKILLIHILNLMRE